MCGHGLILAGHHRYAHISAIRMDGVNPALLGMERVLSEDAVRRALKRIDEKAGVVWLERQLERVSDPLRSTPWILDRRHRRVLYPPYHFSTPPQSSAPHLWWLPPQRCTGACRFV